MVDYTLTPVDAGEYASAGVDAELALPRATTDTVSLSDSFTGAQKWIFSSTLELSDSLVVQYTKALTDAIALSSVFSPVLIQHQVTLTDTLALSDLIERRAREALVDTFSLSDTVEVGRIVLLIADTLRLSDSVIAQILNTVTVNDTIGFADIFGRNARWELSDALSFTDTVLDKIRQLLSISSTLTLDDSFTHSFSIQLLFTDSLSLTDSVDWSIQKVLAFASNIGFIGNFRFDGERYDVWAFNPRTMAVFELDYSKPIKGLGRLAGKNVVVREDGVFEVGGVDDNGETFDAFLRTGITDFDDPERHFPGENIKQLLQGYLVHTSTGDTLLKIRTTRRGKLIETWFKCRDKPEVMTKSQVPLSNSLRSLLFQFELVPLKSKPAQFHAVEIVPLFLKRSI